MKIKAEGYHAQDMGLVDIILSEAQLDEEYLFQMEDWWDKTPYEYKLGEPRENINQGVKEFWWPIYRKPEDGSKDWKHWRSFRTWGKEPDYKDAQRELEIAQELEREKREAEAKRQEKAKNEPKRPYKPYTPDDDYRYNRQWSGD